MGIVRRCVLAGVVEEVREHLLDAVGVAVDHHRGVRDRDGRRRRPTPLLNAVHRRADLVGEVHRVPDVAEATRLDALGVEDVAGHRLEAARVGEGAAYGAVPVLVAHDLPVVEARLQEAEHPGHRCAQLVGDDRDELVLGAVELAQAGLLLPRLPQPPCENDRQREADGEQQQDEDEAGRLQGPGEGLHELRRGPG